MLMTFTFTFDRNTVQKLMHVTAHSKLLKTLARTCWIKNIMPVLTSVKSWKQWLQREKSWKSKKILHLLLKFKLDHAPTKNLLYFS